MKKTAYTLVHIDGDYAVLVTAAGDENRLARALLPDDVGEGDCIVYQDFGFHKEKDV